MANSRESTEIPSFPIFHGKSRRSFPDLKSSFAVKDREFSLLDLSREKKIFNSNFPTRAEDHAARHGQMNLDELTTWKRISLR
jgi:hypothetical protein